MKDKLEEYKIFYHRINQDILEISNLCGVCAQKNIDTFQN